MRKVVLLLASLSLCSLSFALTAVADEPSRDQGSELHFVHIEQLADGGGKTSVEVVVTNVKGETICISNTVFSNYALELDVDGTSRHEENGIVGRPTPGCDKLKRGKALHYAYDISKIFREYDLHGRQVCFRFFWKYLQDVDSQDNYQYFPGEEVACTILK